MASKQIPFRDFIRGDGGWSLWVEVDNKGAKTAQTERITAAYIQGCYHELKRANDLLQSIHGLLLSLGRDGLHDVIKHHRGVAHRARKREQTRRRLDRQRTQS